MWLFKRAVDHKGFVCENDEKFSIVKNVVLISFGFTFLFTAYNSSAALQSSVNKVRQSLVVYITVCTMKFGYNELGC